MGITYRVDASRGLIFERWAGPLTAEDLAAYYRTITVDPIAMALRRSLADIREAELHFTGAELQHLIATLVIPALRGRGWRSAILVREQEQFGVARQYQVFADLYSQDAIFTEEGPALQWLEDPTADPPQRDHDAAGSEAP